MTVPDITEALAAQRGVTLLGGPEAVDYAVDGYRPLVVARPQDAAAVSAVLRIASERGLRVVPRGGGTFIGLGNAPAGLDVVLDLSAMDRVVEYRPRDLTVTVEAGMTVAAMQRVLDEQRQIVALDPPLPETATVGGTLAANVTGPRRFRYGAARDIVIGTAAVLADGTEIKSGGRVVKNVAGYDLNKLFIGSLGTLAVITRVTFKLIPAPPERGMVAGVFATLEQAAAAAQRIAASTLGPLTLDLVSPQAAGDLADALPAAPAGSWLLAVELGGTRAAVDRARADLVHVMRAGGCRAMAEPPPIERERVTAALRDFGHPAGERAALVLRASVLPAETTQVCRLFAATADPSGAPPAIVARAGSGSVLGAWPTAEPDAVRSLVHRLRGDLRSLGGTLAVERCAPEAKQGLDVWGIDGPDLTLMRRVKQAFDPAGILSPGRGPGNI